MVHYKRGCIPRAAVRRHLKKTAKPNVAQVRDIVKKTVSKKLETKMAYAEVQANFDYADAGIEFSDDTAQSVSDQSRIGDQIEPTSLMFKGYIQWTSTATTLVPVRMLTIQQRNDNDTSLGLHQILATTTQAFVTQSPYHHDNRRLFNVLGDKVYQPPVFGSTVHPTLQRAINYRCKKPAKIYFKPGSTDTVSGKITQYYISNQSDNNNIPLFLGVSQFFYKDG